MTTKPRYYVEKRKTCVGDDWLVRDREAMPGTQILAAMASEVAARQAAEALNRGLCEAIAPDGRWTQPEDKP